MLWIVRWVVWKALQHFIFFKYYNSLMFRYCILLLSSLGLNQECCQWMSRHLLCFIQCRWPYFPSYASIANQICHLCQWKYMEHWPQCIKSAIYVVTVISGTASRWSLEDTQMHMGVNPGGGASPQFLEWRDEYLIIPPNFLTCLMKFCFLVT